MEPEKSKPFGIETVPPPDNKPRQMSPLSPSALDFLKTFGWIIAIASIISGGYIISNAPAAPDDLLSKYRGEDISVKIQSTARIIILSWGIGQIVAGLVIGVLMNVISGIGYAVLDIWKDKSKTSLG